MARPRAFDTDAALQGAMEIFWRQGYKATNLPDLLHAMGITRGSFYKAFRDKEAVYLAALDLYDRTQIEASVVMLSECAADDPVDCLAAMFAPQDDPQAGCFACNAMVEMAPVNARVAERTAAIAARLGASVAALLRRHGHREPAALDRADMIVHLFFGHKALGKVSAPAADWHARIAAMLA